MNTRFFRIFAYGFALNRRARQIGSAVPPEEYIDAPADGDAVKRWVVDGGYQGGRGGR